MAAARKVYPRKQPRGQRDLSLPVQEWRFDVGSPEHGLRLDEFVARRLRWRSRASLQRAIAGGRVDLLPHKDPQQTSIGRRRASLRLRRGQQVVVRLDAPDVEAGFGAATWDPLAISVVYEDEAILAVSKPPHVSVYPSRRHRASSLIQQVHARERQLYDGRRYPPTLCHRLDRETSGLVLFARSRRARAELSAQFEERTVEKRYLAVVSGEVEEDTGRIDLPLGRDQTSAVEIKMGIVPPPAGQPAVSGWRVVGRRRGRTLLEVAPETGRQHQIRVHLAALGHPIIGDKLYFGGDGLFLRWLDGELREQDRERLQLDRQALHAWRLEVCHPLTAAPLYLEAALWPDLAKLADGLDPEALLSRK